MAVDAALLDRLTTELFREGDVQVAGAENFAPHAVIGGHGSSPLIVVPAHGRKEAGATLLRWTDHTSPGDAAKRISGWIAFRSGLGFGRLERVFVRATSPDSPTLHQHLGFVFDTPEVGISASFGPPRPNQKPILRVFDTAGSTLGFVKVGWNTLTRDLVAHEAAFLRDHSRSLRLVAVPEVVSHSQWEGRSLEALRPLEGGMKWRSVKAPSAAMLAEVTSLSDRYWAPLGESPIRRRIATSDDPLVVRAIQLLDNRWGEQSIPFGHWHGDWVPWNMRHAGARLIVWDWERNAPHVPVGFDALHYEFQRRAVRSSHTMETLTMAVAAAAPIFRSLGVPDGADEALALLYLVELHHRFEATAADEPEIARAHAGTIAAVLEEGISHFAR